MATHILGIRHHGVGSAKQVKARLEQIKPDCILIEGPPEITDMLGLVAHENMKPPVALLVYDTKNAQSSALYPFAEYSPEWIAANYAQEHNIPVRAIDKTAAQSMHEANKRAAKEEEQEPEINIDPLDHFAAIANLKNGEQWWDQTFEQNTTEPEEHFESVLLTMSTLREAEDNNTLRSQENLDREVCMRMQIREVQNEMYENIVVICGAWHAPALIDIEQYVKDDLKRSKKFLKSRLKIASTWIPWTNSRLSFHSGYGAGIHSPGWYEHLWLGETDREISWLTKVAKKFRAEGFDISTAHIIETQRLAYSLAALRNKSIIGLEELNEATIAVMCMGDKIKFHWIEQRLVINERIGRVPTDINKVPLQADFEEQFKKMRFRFEIDTIRRKVELDLRKPLDLKRSIFFHQLAILQIDWANEMWVKSKGTFKESWSLDWEPYIMIQLIDKAHFGNTIEEAANQRVKNVTNQANKVYELAELIQEVLPAELFSTIDFILDRINELSADSSDFLDLFQSIPKLIEVSRYGDVRNSDSTILNRIIDELLIKLFIGLHNACYGVNEEVAHKFEALFHEMDKAIRIYENNDFLDQWYATLNKLSLEEDTQALIAGVVYRILLDAKHLEQEEANRRITLALSVSNDPQYVVQWLEGFLRGDAMILLYDNQLWNLIYTWISALPNEIFIEMLPSIRRAFAHFDFASRKRIGEKVGETERQGMVQTSTTSESGTMNINQTNAAMALPILLELMKPKNETTCK